jgi:hypothetical protein
MTILWEFDEKHHMTILWEFNEEHPKHVSAYGSRTQGSR